MRGTLIFIIFLFNHLLKSQDSVKAKWVDFSINGALIINNSLSNIYRYELDGQNINATGVQIKTTYSNIKSKPICLGFSGGFDFEIGKKTHFKQLVNFNYDYTNSYFNRNHYNSSYNHSSSSVYIENVNIKRTVQFFGFNYGVLFKTDSHFHISILACYNYILKTEEKRTGFYLSSDINGVNYLYDTITINSKNIYKGGFTYFLFLKLKLGYNINIQNQNVTVFMLKNLNATNVLYPTNGYLTPWWVFGIQYYPFKNKLNKYRNEKTNL